jgi:hypothetical protein
MDHVLRFQTDKFDVAKERDNPFNEIPGESLLLWLRDRVRPQCDISAPEPEDWGWYSEVNWQGRSYMLGASASEEEAGQREWILQIVKHRTLLEKVLGREKMTSSDACALFFRQVLEQEPAFRNLSVD